MVGLSNGRDQKEGKSCRLMKCTTVLHGGLCDRISTPHKSGNKMKELCSLIDQDVTKP